MTSRKLRVGAVSYLNSKPLLYGLDEQASTVELALDVPSRLADRLAEGELDVALIPSIETFRDPSYTVVSDACIACRGPVLSVKLFFRRPPQSVRRLALDEGSRTSVALARTLLAQRFNLHPQLEPLPLGASIDETDADAVLLIGDRAIHSPVGRFAAVWDLGDEWYRSTGLPFIFAMWTARPSAQLGTLEAVLAEARDRGLANLEQIATAEAPALGLTQPQCLSYLRDNLHFRLGPQEEAGLQRFYDSAAALDLVPKGLRFGSARRQTA